MKKFLNRPQTLWLIKRIKKTTEAKPEQRAKGQNHQTFMSTFFIQRDLFIIDESLSNVDEVTAEKLLNIFSYLHQNSLIIFCTHNSQFKKYYHHQLEVTQWNE
jgi:ABC-type lipoprotein export system ATPase subunit